MSLRTRTDSAAYSAFVSHFAVFVAMCCVGYFVLLGVAYISALGVGRALVWILESAVVRLKKFRAGAAEDGGDDEVVVGAAGAILLEMVEAGDCVHGVINPLHGVDEASGGADELAHPARGSVVETANPVQDAGVDPLAKSRPKAFTRYTRICPETGRVIVCVNI